MISWLFAASSSAMELDSSKFRFSGYGTFAAGKVIDSEPDALFFADTPSGAFYDDRLEVKPETMLGTQLDVDLGEGLRLGVQMTAKGGTGFDTELEWLYLNYDIVPALSLQVGRVRIPYYHFSESIEVGYTYHWLRPPTEIYISAVTVMEGGKFIYTTHWGDVDIQTQVFGGSTDPVPAVIFSRKFDATIEAGLHKIYGANLEFTYESLSFRLGMTHAAANGFFQDNSNILGGGAGVVYPVNPETAKDDTYLSSLFYDDGKFLLGAEGWVKDSDTGGRNNPAISWYVTSGYRFGNWLPSLTYSNWKDKSEKAIGTGEIDQSTITFALRWDFQPNAALKLQIDNISTNGEPSSSLPSGLAPVPDLQFTNPANKAGNVDDLTVIAIGIDFIF